MPDRDLILLRFMLEAIGKIRHFTRELKDADEFEKDIKSFDATVMNFIILGEAVGKLSESFKERYEGIDWRKVYAFRNVLAHDYFGIYPEEVWQIIQKDIPALEKQLVSILNS